MRATTSSRRPVRVVTVDWHDRAWRPRIKAQLAGRSDAFRSLAGEKMGRGLIWWGEAAGEPAREGVRPTGSCNIYPHHTTPWLLSGCLLRGHRRIQFPTQ